MWSKIFKALSGLVMEHDSGRFSVGRLAFWPVLIVALVEWGINDREIALYHFLTLVLLLVYNTGSKMLTVIREVKSFASGIGVNVQALPPQADKALEMAAKAGDALNAKEAAEDAAKDEDEDDEPDEGETAGG